VTVSRRDFALLADGRLWTGEATVREGRALIAREDLPDALGLELKPEGLCQGPLCIPVQNRTDLVVHDGVDLAALADVLGRPLALDLDGGAAALGESATDQRRRLETLDAPDFELTDVAGKRHRLSDHRGKKILLHAYASW